MLELWRLASTALLGGKVYICRVTEPGEKGRQAVADLELIGDTVGIDKCQEWRVRSWG